MGLRITVLIGGACLLYGALTFNIYNLQIQKGEFYSAKAASISKFGEKQLPLRGSIYFTDKNNNLIPASINRNYPTVYTDNREIEDVPEAAGTLGPIINKSVAELTTIFSKKNDPYEPILKRASEELVVKIKEADIAGIHIEEEPARYYPFESLAAHALGFVSTEPSNPNGVYGAEAYYNSDLYSVDASKEGSSKTGLVGQDLHLTIDRNIQAESEKLLENLVKTFKAEGGSVIIEDPKTGKILTLANFPTFDPNNYSDANIKNFLNPAVQAIYEPGSVIKLVTIAAGLDSGAITPETSYFDTGSVTLNKKTIKNFRDESWGRQTMTGVIEHSINTGAVFAQRAMGRDTFYDYLVKFGFNGKTNIDLPGEVVGGLKALEKNARDINFATASFGQGLQVTPISVIRAVSAIANDGVMMRPYINADKSPEIVERVISKETSQKVQKMMVTAVNTNAIAPINGYNVAGKTGTAQVPDFKHGGYSDDVINTFVGFAPAYDPAFVILFKLNKPAGGPQAGQTVVPAFRELARFILNYYNIAPDNIQGNTKSE